MDQLAGDLSSDESGDDDYVPSGGEDVESEVSDQDEGINDGVGDTLKRLADDKESEEPPSKKAHLDDLWADFASSYDTPKATTSDESKSKPTFDQSACSSETPDPPKIADNVFAEFVSAATSSEKDETSNKTNEVENREKEELKTDDKTEPIQKRASAGASNGGFRGVLKKQPVPSVPEKSEKPGGFGAALAAMKGKKTTLNKSKEDWEKFKADNQLHEELQTHNRGKDGYLQRQEFLQRVDYKTFEVERDLRQAKRKPPRL